LEELGIEARFPQLFQTFVGINLGREEILMGKKMD
jgi:hypothetical protein